MKKTTQYNVSIFPIWQMDVNLSSSCVVNKDQTDGEKKGERIKLLLGVLVRLQIL